MKSVQTRVPRTRGLIAALVVLGVSSALLDAVAELPKAGKYTGTVTVSRVFNGPGVREPLLHTLKYKALARVDADGYVRVSFTGGPEPVFGKLVESGSTLSLAVNG